MALERDIEGEVTRYAEGKGCLQIKLTLWGRIGWPDRMYLYHGGVLFIEYKRPGEKPIKVQLYVQAQLIRHGFAVAVIDTILEGKECIDDLVNTVDSKRGDRYDG